MTVTVILSIQMGEHLVPYKLPKNIAKSIEGIGWYFPGEQFSKTEWIGVHVIFPECTCANSLVDQLASRGPKDGVSELVLVRGTSLALENKLVGAGFQVENVSKGEFSNVFAIESAPVMFIFKNGQLFYLGGYYSRPADFRSLDQEVMKSLLNGEIVDPLPLYGCGYFDTF